MYSQGITYHHTPNVWSPIYVIQFSDAYFFTHYTVQSGITNKHTQITNQSWDMNLRAAPPPQQPAWISQHVQVSTSQDGGPWVLS